MADSFAASAFADNLMRGFSFVDEIKARNRAEARLETRLSEQRQERTFQRQRTQEADRQVRQDRGFAQLERDFVAETRREDKDRELRGREANKLLADPNSDLGLLQEYADFPNVAAEINRRRVIQQDQRDAETVFGPGAQRPSPGAVTDPAAPEDIPQAPAGFVEALKPPSDELTTQRRLTDDELNLLANEDPAAARELRDQQNAAPRNILDVPVTRGPSVERERLRKQGARADITAQWDQFADIANETGDALRELDSNLLTAKYWEDRSNISKPDIQRNADTRMRPHIQETIETQTEARLTAEPNSREFRNASRKLSKAYGLANEIGFTFSPSEAAGVTGGGLPLDRNAQLTANVVESTQTGPGTPLPANPNQQRMDNTIVQRGTTGRRLNRKQLDAAYRMYKGGRLSLASYQTYMNTGQLPSGTKTSVVQMNPKLDTWMVITDASGNEIGRKIVERARDPDKNTGRNVVSGDALSNLNNMASAYNTGDDKTRGTDLLGGFLSVLEQNENAGRAAGYDYGNVNDVASLYQRYQDLYVFRDAYNDEWFFNGDWDPDFTQDFGSIAQALFSRKVETAIASGEFEDPRSGETIAGITPLKTLTAADIENIRANVPELAEASAEEVQAAYDAQTRR